MSLCGSCTMCCKLLGIPELEKPATVWCTHCDIGKGCRIYDDRPADCQTYTCVWRSFKEDGYPVPDELRPDRCGAIVDAAADGSGHYVRVDPMKPDAWRKAVVQQFIQRFFSVGEVWLVCGNHLRTLKNLN